MIVFISVNGNPLLQHLRPKFWEICVYTHTHTNTHSICRASLMAQTVKNLPVIWKNWVWSWDREDPLKKRMVTYSSILSWGIPWTEEPGRLQSMGSQSVGHNWATNTHNICEVKVAQSYLTLCNPMDCSLSASYVLGILQARILEWIAMPSSRGSSQPRDGIRVSCIAGGFFTVWDTREVVIIIIYSGEKARNLGHVQKS